MHVNVRNVGKVRVCVCMLCVCDTEEREDGVGAGVNATILSETLEVVLVDQFKQLEQRSQSIVDHVVVDQLNQLQQRQSKYCRVVQVAVVELLRNRDK